MFDDSHFHAVHKDEPVTSASEVTTIWRYTNVYIIIIIIKRPNVVTHAGIVSSVGIWRSVASVCLFVHALTGKRLEISTPNLVHIYYIAVSQHALTQRSKGQGHTVTKTITVARMLVSGVTMAGIPYSYMRAVLPAAVAGVRLHVDTTACVF